MWLANGRRQGRMIRGVPQERGSTQGQTLRCGLRARGHGAKDVAFPPVRPSPRRRSPPSPAKVVPCRAGFASQPHRKGPSFARHLGTPLHRVIVSRDTDMTSSQRVRDTLRNNGLALAMLVLFVGSWVGQFLAGLAAFNAERRDHGQPAMAAVDYPRTSHFWEATFENWESEFLQMSAFVLLTAVLYQKGSAESKRIGAIETVDVDPRLVSTDESPGRREARGPLAAALRELARAGVRPALRRVLHRARILGLVTAYNGDQLAHNQPPGVHLGLRRRRRSSGSSRSRTGRASSSPSLAMVVLTIYLRQRGSPESKPVFAPHSETGRS